jgi:hypothetical protein
LKPSFRVEVEDDEAVIFGFKYGEAAMRWPTAEAGRSRCVCFPALDDDDDDDDDLPLGAAVNARPLLLF